MNLDLFNDGISTYTGETDGLERYYTPTPIVDALLSRIAPGDLRHNRRVILEPCAGRARSIADAAAGWRGAGGKYTVVTGDLDPGADVDHHGDALAIDWRSKIYGRYFWRSITNPPFSLAAPLVRHLAEHTEHAITMLVRLSFLEPVEDRLDVLTGFDAKGPLGRAKTWRISDVLVTPRQKFRQASGGSSTDSVTTAWVTWMPDREEPARFDIITRAEEERWKIARAEGRLGVVP